jgi:hypothetical protein
MPKSEITWTLGKLPIGKICEVKGEWREGYGFEYCMPLKTNDLEDYSCAAVKYDEDSDNFVVEIFNEFAWVSDLDLEVMVPQPVTVQTCLRR